MEMNYWNLITKHLTSELNSDEQRDLQNWIDQSPENAELFAKAKRLWALSGDFDFDFQPDKQKDWAKLKSKILAEASDSPTHSVRSPRPYWLKIAAAVALIAGLGYVLSTMENENPIGETLAYVEMEATDSVLVFYLPDSTQIWLNRNSSFSYPEKFTAEERGVNLKGEAFFQVERDTATPFIVYAGKTQTRVLGTSFNVRAYEDDEEIEVVVVEGKVEFSTEEGESQVILEVDDKATYNKDKRTYKKGSNQENEFKWWLKDLGEEIEDAGEEIEEDVKRFFKRAKNKVNKKKKGK